MKNLNYFILTFVIVVFSSCSNTDKTDLETNANLSVEEISKTLREKLNDHNKETKLVEVDQIDGKTSIDYYREWQRDVNTPIVNTCTDTPDCPKITFNSVYNLDSGCDIAFSFDLYYCGPGGAGIYNFQMTPLSGGGSDCSEYNAKVTENYDNGYLMEAQANYNYYASIILSDIEDVLFNFIPTSGGNTLIATYLPNICSVTCESDGTQKECGENCCIRFAFYKKATGSRTTSVSSIGDCGETTVPCGDCESSDCAFLDNYNK